MHRGLVRFARRPGDVSDDTQLTIAVARSIRDDGTYSEAQFLTELAAWSGFRVGAGRASSRAAARARRGQAPRGLPSEGNGVAIRVVPFAIARASCTDEELASVVAENGRVTHTSDAAIQPAVFVALLTRSALTQPRGAFAQFPVLAAAMNAARMASGFQFETPAPARIDTDEALDAILRRTGTSGHVQQCVPAALAVLLRHGLNYVSAMRTVFHSGGDTDSIGAIVGSIIGGQLGVAELPPSWNRDVQHRDYLCVLADRLAEPSAKTSLDAQFERP
jgi:ADP-ribosylglycohydrolase